MKYYIYGNWNEGNIYGKLIKAKPHRSDYPKMDIDAFEDVEMEWQQAFDALPEIPVHPDLRIKEYFMEVMSLQFNGEGIECDVVDICQDVTKWFPVQCEKCGWVGCSSELDGGGQIADTRDYGDAYCPCCKSVTAGDEIENTCLIPSQEVLKEIIQRSQMSLSKFIKSDNQDELIGKHKVTGLLTYKRSNGSHYSIDKKGDVIELQEMPAEYKQMWDDVRNGNPDTIVIDMSNRK